MDPIALFWVLIGFALGITVATLVYMALLAWGQRPPF